MTLRLGEATCDLDVSARLVVLDVGDYVNPVKGKALDLLEMAPHGNYDANIMGTGDYKDIAGADVAIVTAGTRR